MGAAPRGTSKRLEPVTKAVAVVKKEVNEADQALQAMLNRISFLKCEEAKLDRDIDNTRKRTQELLNRKAERARHDDVVVAVQDVLGTMQGDMAKGRSTLKGKPAAKPANKPSALDSTNEALSTGTTGIKTQPEPSICSTAPSASPLQKAASFRAPVLPTPHAIPTARSASGSMQITSRAAPGTTTAVLLGDLSPMGSRKASRQASGGRSRSSLSEATGRANSCSPDLQSHNSTISVSHDQTCTTITTQQGQACENANPNQTAECGSPTCIPPESHSSSQMQVLQPGTGTTSTAGRATQAAASTPQPGMVVLDNGQSALSVSGDTSARPSVPHVNNCMMVLTPEGPPVSCPDDEVPDEELVGVLGRETVQPFVMQGLQQFTMQATPKVIQVRSTAAAAPIQVPSTVVVAAGVGWGLGPLGVGPAAPAPALPPQIPATHTPRAPSTGATVSNRTSGSNVSVGNRAASVSGSSSTSAIRPGSSCGRNSSAISTASSATSGHRPGTASGSAAGQHQAKHEQKVVQQEPDMSLKQQIWRVRKVFGLEATPTKDPSATVDECGGGAWT